MKAVAQNGQQRMGAQRTHWASVWREPMMTSLCLARVKATLLRRQSRSNCPTPVFFERTKEITMQSLSRLRRRT